MDQVSESKLCAESVSMMVVVTKKSYGEGLRLLVYAELKCAVCKDTFF